MNRFSALLLDNYTANKAFQMMNIHSDLELHRLNSWIAAEYNLLEERLR